MRVLLASLALVGHTYALTPLAISVRDTGEEVYAPLAANGLRPFRPADSFYEVHAEDLEPELTRAHPETVAAPRQRSPRRGPRDRRGDRPHALPDEVARDLRSAEVRGADVRLTQSIKCRDGMGVADGFGSSPARPRTCWACLKVGHGVGSTQYGHSCESAWAACLSTSSQAVATVTLAGSNAKVLGLVGYWPSSTNRSTSGTACCHRYGWSGRQRPEWPVLRVTIC